MALPMGVDVVNATIISGSSKSGVVAIGPKVLHGLVMPATWTSAPVSFEVSLDGTTFQPLADKNGAIIAVSLAAQGNTISLDPNSFRGVALLKIVSGVPGTLVNQGQDSTVGLITKAL